MLAHTRNELEERFLGLCETSALPLPEMNVEIGPFTVDALFHEQRLIVELDGGAAHGRPAAVVRDRNRELYLRERGYRVIRYSWLQVFENAERVAADLRRALAARYQQLRGRGSRRSVQATSRPYDSPSL